VAIAIALLGDRLTQTLVVAAVFMALGAILCAWESAEG
jgi:uncharacterized membrane protein YqjE